MTELSFYDHLVYVWLAVAAVTFVALQFIAAPYGRHSRRGWGPTIHRTPGWVIMESPAVWGPLVFFFLGNRTGNPVAIAFLCIWLLHYVNRTLVFPFRLRGGQLRMPLAIVDMGLIFNFMNAYLQGRYLFSLGPVHEIGWLSGPKFSVGLGLFLAGFALNLHSDSILRNLRKPGETGYKIPQGGAYRWVSSPNYLGELMEWAGWAIATWSIAGLVFLLWTAANLVPRARTHHRWYKEQFPDYPRDRKALLPFLY